MKKILILAFCFLPLIILWATGAEKIPVAELKLVCSFPEDDLYFGSFPAIDIDKEGFIYAVDNREHTVFIFNKEGKLLGKFGGWGQGPGELQWPAKISVDKKSGEIFVKDNTGINMFGPGRDFIRRIRTFTGILNLDAGNGRIAVIEPIPGENDLIGLYDYRGFRIKSLGRKYDLDYSKSQEIPPVLLDRMANEGTVLLDGNHVYYVSYVFAEIRKYDLSGEPISEKKLSSPEDIEKYRKQYRQILFETGVKKNKDGTITNIRILNDACLYGEHIYLLMLGYITNGRYQIIVVDKQSLEVKKRMILPSGLWPENIRVFPSNNTNTPLFLISFQDQASGSFLLGILKED